MTDAAAHRAEVEAWRSSRYAALRRDVGWLTLAGLGWLRPGENTLGTDASADVPLPSGPPVAGAIELSSDGAVATGAFLHAGTPIDHLVLADDRDGEPTMLELGPLRLCVIERGGRHAVRTWDTSAPARDTFDGIDHWPVDPAWRLDATFEPTPNVTVTVPDVIGVSEVEPSPGTISFEVAGEEHRLQALAGGERGELWLVFADATSGRETYAGGRFLYTPAPADGRVVVDFNRAYNPPCVFSPYATCPLPWPENRLSVRVEAGERMFGLHR